MEQNKTEQKEYVVIWHYCANYGMSIYKAINPTEAIRQSLFFNRKEVQLIAFENNKETSAFKDFGSNDVANPIPEKVNASFSMIEV